MTDNRTLLGKTSSPSESIGELTAQAVDLHGLYVQCAASYPDVALTSEDFSNAIVRAVDKYLVNFAKENNAPSLESIRAFVGELQQLDLFLTLACAKGCEQAWWLFDRTHRHFIERLAHQFAGRGMDPSEVIDSVYVELYGTKTVNGVRQSKFRTYTGRGTLRGWLRTVISNTVVDLYRARHNEVPLEEWSKANDELSAMSGLGKTYGSETLMLENVARERYRKLTIAALDHSLATLDSRETLLLLYYHVEGLKLREIAKIADAPSSSIRSWFQRRMVKPGNPNARVHESTVMRWLERVYGKVAETFRSELKNKHGLNPAEIEICLEIATQDFGQGLSLNLDRSDSKNFDQAEGAS